MAEFPSTPRKAVPQRNLTTSPYFSPKLRMCRPTRQRNAQSAPSSPQGQKVPNLLTFDAELPMGPAINWKKPALRICDEEVDWYRSQFELLDDPSYAFKLRKSTYLNFVLYRAKPMLIQEKLADDPWKLLLAVTLLNKTAGKSSIPVFWKLVERWPNPESLAQETAELRCLLQPLGLQNVRARRMIDMSSTYLSDPPIPNHLRKSRASISYMIMDKETGLQRAIKLRYPPTPISHLPGVGAYALDSYRLFCSKEDEWKSVMPSDKELIKYLKWKWAFDGCRWEPTKGLVAPLDVEYLEALPEILLG